ncbi:uncharacterized protein LOC143026159 [Oratosquilla oratoria]|uniref:uncharacterized protein LOC143026159 n=1 Tax=Oratosquilla oratoria TaxID=337810 RepID=UPI003F75F476
MQRVTTENFNCLLKEVEYGTKTFGHLESLLQILIDSVPKLKEEEKELETRIASIEEEINSSFSLPPSEKHLDGQACTPDKVQLELKTCINCTSHEVKYITQQREAMVMEMNMLKLKRNAKLEELASLQRDVKQKSEDVKLMECATKEEISICKEVERQSSESIGKLKELLSQVTRFSIHIKKNNILYHMENKRKEEQKEKERILLETKKDVQYLKDMIEGAWEELNLLIGEVEDFESNMCQQVQDWRLNLDKLWKQKTEAIRVFFESSDKLIEQMIKWRSSSSDVEEIMVESTIN